MFYIAPQRQLLFIPILSNKSKLLDIVLYNINVQ